jgi:hypothetical protein
MNILDVDDMELPEGDLLKTIFDEQAKLIEKYHSIEKDRGAIVVDPNDFGNLDYRFTQWRIKDLAYRTIEELSEATNCLKSKPWKQSEIVVDKTHYYEELADAFHFLVELLITSGLDAEDLALLYHKKHAVNEFRIRTNY